MIFKFQSQHKIHSTEGSLVLELENVPKMLHLLKTIWIPDSFVVSFKLETDAGILFDKSFKSLEKNKHDLVIGNVLSTRKEILWFVNRKEEIFEIKRKDDLEIEEEMIHSLKLMHLDYINQI